MAKYIVRGIFVDNKDKDHFRIRNGELLIEDGVIVDYSDHFEMNDVRVYDYSDKIIIPGFSDLHLHAPQYEYAGSLMDLELLDWLQNYTYPIESKYKDLEYARENYKYLVRDLVNSVTTRCSVFATIYTDSTLLLMDLLEEANIVSYVGKLSMDRFAPDYYLEKDGYNETKRFIEIVKKRDYKYVKASITPRFTPSVSDKYMEEIGGLVKKYDLASQSHLSENLDEIKWVHELRPNDNYYYESYSKNNMFNNKTIMAHCIYSSKEEMEAIYKNKVYIAHCPTSNINVIAGLCPSTYYLRNGYNIGLGSDVSGGNTLDMFEVVKTSIQVSKIRYKYVDSENKPLSLEEAFYMGTVIGGSYFGNVGKFDKGYMFDACVLDDSANKNNRDFSIRDRIERMVYLNSKKISAKFVNGNKIK